MGSEKCIRDSYYNFGLWQYSDNAQVQGIDASVDINVSFKNYG